MSEKEVNQIISENLVKLIDSNNTSQTALAEYVGVSQPTISDWCKGKKMPRMDKIDKICQYFKISREAIMTAGLNPTNYYFDEEVRELANELKNRSELKVLFDASRNATKEDIEFVIQMLDKMNNK